jgi:hypothetical protein
MAAAAAGGHSAGMRFQKLEHYGRFVIDAPLTPQQAAQQVVAAVAKAKAQMVARLLVDLRAMTNSPSSTVTERYDLGQDIACASAGMRQIAFAMRPEALTLYDFTFLVISNRGTRAAGFASEQEALAWLLAPPVGGGVNLPKHRRP